MSRSIERRRFLATAAAAATAGTLRPETLGGSESSPGVAAPSALPLQTPQQEPPPPIPLGNGEPPALQFQAYPGGTGALMEKLWRDSGDSPFERTEIDIERWSGQVPTSEEDVAFLPVHRLAALIRAREITSSELTEVYLDRLKRLDPVLLCAVTILEGRAQEEARQADLDLAAGDWRGPLHGIPYGIKDLFAVAGTRTTWGAADFSSQFTRFDSEVAVRLRDAGAVLIAKLATGEFARGDRWYRGRTLNPWNLDEGSSGSSAGPGSATAAACVAFAIGTETQGSIVSPARRCGLTALRPTFGRVSRYGGMVLSWSMDKTGPMCRSALDCALVFNAMHGADEKDPGSLTAPFRFDPAPDLGAMRIGYTEDAPESFVEALRGLGADPQPMPEIPSGRSNALGVESSAAFDFHVAPDGELPPIPADADEAERRRRGRFRGSRDIPALDFVQSQRRRLILMKEMAEVMQDFDMFVSGSGQVGLTNQTGHPAAVVPYDYGVRNPDSENPTEMPLTTTLIGDLFADDRILSVVHAFQEGTEWHLRRPEIG
ncbi:MAG: amidase [Gemmatimonadota bacterium]|nr:amidase [Gemmatimonadota bacterium]MDE2986029.1 amidase [Gemmatimonadota bacterium]